MSYLNKEIDSNKLTEYDTDFLLSVKNDISYISLYDRKMNLLYIKINTELRNREVGNVQV